jgi:deazaflavin-dependent oxidoreductase (nitroreductase family)
VTGTPAREPDVCYLTTTGRRTGEPHRIEIWFGQLGETVYLLAGGARRSDWVLNLRGDPDVSLEIGDRKRATRARVVEAGTDEDAQARALLLAKYDGGENGDLAGWAATSLVVALAWPSGTTYTSLL